jgi:hypothetical protein
MSPDSPPAIDLFDLKLLPAWVKEPAETKSYAHYTGEEDQPGRKSKRSGSKPFRARPSISKGKPGDARPDRLTRQRKDFRQPRENRDRQNRPPVRPHRPLKVAVRFLPRSAVFENVIEQIKSGAVAYSLFHLARLFLEKPERYDVRLTAKPESPVYQLGEGGAVSVDREFLDENAFRLAWESFYKIDITQGEPIKGNFASVARDRLSGVLLGPTNHHTYQPRLRTLYEQRFSRRMSFADYQRQIEIVTEPTLVERWKEEAQKVTTYSTAREQTPATFSSSAVAERHFRSTYLPGLVRSVEETTIDGVSSRHLPDRPLHRAIEDAWAHENRSPSNLMQELAGRFRQAGLHIFRHHRGMLFVSPVRVRAFVHEQAGVSPSINSILETLAAMPGINRKQLAEKLIVDLPPKELESRKLALASDLHWLISEGHVIEFSDNSLDLPRTKTKSVEPTVKAADENIAAAGPVDPAEGTALDTDGVTMPAG